jgi:hypothetical protein
MIFRATISASASLRSVNLKAGTGRGAVVPTDTRDGSRPGWWCSSAVAKPPAREQRGRAAAMRWNLNAGRALRSIVIRGGGGLAMTDWTGIGSGPLLAGLLLACWFGFLLWLLYFAATTPP